MLSNSNVFILLILVKHSALLWLIVLTGAIATRTTIDVVDVTTTTTDAAAAAFASTANASSNLANSFDYYKNVISSVANAKNQNKHFGTTALNADAGRITFASSPSPFSSSATAYVFRLNGTVASEANQKRLHNNGSHFVDIVTAKDYKPSATKLSTPSVSTMVFQATKTYASTMTPAPSAQIKTLSKLKLPDLSRKNNKSSNDNNNAHNDSVVRVSIDGIVRNGNDISQHHHHNDKINENHNDDVGDDGAAIDDDSGNNELPQADSSTIDLSSSRLPEFPQRSDAVYFIVAVVGGAKIWSRTLARTLIEMGPPFGSPQGPPLRPLYIDLPANGR